LGGEEEEREREKESINEGKRDREKAASCNSVIRIIHFPP
jgi:hypothetical protein